MVNTSLCTAPATIPVPANGRANCCGVFQRVIRGLIYACPQILVNVSTTGKIYTLKRRILRGICKEHTKWAHNKDGVQVGSRVPLQNY